MGHKETSNSFLTQRLYTPNKRYTLGSVGWPSPPNIRTSADLQSPNFGPVRGASSSVQQQGGDGGSPFGGLGGMLMMAPSAVRGLKWGADSLSEMFASGPQGNPYGLDLGDTSLRGGEYASQVPHTDLASIPASRGLDLGVGGVEGGFISSGSAPISSGGAISSGSGSSMAGLGGPAGIAAAAAAHDIPLLMNKGVTHESIANTVTGRAIPGVTSSYDFSQGRIGTGVLNLIPGMPFLTSMFPDFFDF